MTAFELYLYSTLIPNLGTLLMVFCIISIVFTVVGGCMYFGEDKEVSKKYFIMPSILFIVFMCISTALPNADQLKVIVAGSYLTNIQDIEKLPPNAVKYLNQFLEENIKEN
jgi:ABC-type molybdate transport system substrate-binding protein